MNRVNSHPVLSQVMLNQRIAVAVAEKARDVAQSRGEAVIALMDDAAALQRQLVASAASGASPPGVGSRVDVSA